MTEDQMFDVRLLDRHVAKGRTTRKDYQKWLKGQEDLEPQAAVVDYELSMTMPARLTADTGVDSLTHAIEAYVSRMANPFSDTFAVSAMRTIWNELPVAFDEPGNRTCHMGCPTRCCCRR